VRFILALLLTLTPPVAATELPKAQPAKPWGPWARVPAAAEQALASPRLDFLLPHPDDSSKADEGVSPKLELRIKRKEGWGYPLADRAGFKMTFYWLAWESEYANEPYLVDIYTRHGFLLGRFPRTFVYELKLEGSGMLRDGRAINYDGRCPYGIGFCFQTLDPAEHPLGKGGQGRPLEPFRSVAVDPRFVPLGTPLYLPELVGLRLPDGSRHDGCVRADDTGGNIRRRELDFFVESYATYKFLDDQFWGNNHVTPFVEEPRCAYLRHYDPVVDRRSESTDWARIEASRPRPKPGKSAPKPGKSAPKPGKRPGKATSSKPPPKKHATKKLRRRYG
jgi:3D (Asp-Asp-Asp) domain-containing protein